DVATGDTVEGVVIDGNLRPMRSAEDFYRGVWRQRPGEKLRLRIKGREVVLTVDQGTDERRPLLSLFVTRGREWVGWAPQGDYDISARAVEARIGWHKNTGRESNPVEFHPAEVYRKEFYQRGLLPRLFEKKAYVAAPVVEPVLRAWLAETGGPGPELPGVTVVRR